MPAHYRRCGRLLHRQMSAKEVEAACSHDPEEPIMQAAECQFMARSGQSDALAHVGF